MMVGGELLFATGIHCSRCWLRPRAKSMLALMAFYLTLTYRSVLGDVLRSQHARRDGLMVAVLFFGVYTNYNAAHDVDLLLVLPLSTRRSPINGVDRHLASFHPQAHPNSLSLETPSIFFI